MNTWGKNEGFKRAIRCLSECSRGRLGDCAGTTIPGPERESGKVLLSFGHQMAKIVVSLANGGVMYNQRTRFKIQVGLSGDGFPFVTVPREQVDQVQQLFTASGIGHTVPPPQTDQPQQIIQIGRLFDREQVQDVLDSVH
jgi:hypothetical protein